MKNLVFLVSGNGGNLRFISHCIDRRIFRGWQIAAVVADRQCGALAYAVERGIPHFVVRLETQAQEQLAGLLRQLNPDLIVTTVHRILDAGLVSAWGRKMINLHYSLLPAFPGLIGTRPVAAALESGCRFVGTTTHYVDIQVDAGEIIGQSAAPVEPGQPLAAVMNDVFRAGCLNLLNAIDHHEGNSESARERALCAQLPCCKATFSPALRVQEPLAFDEFFWKCVRRDPAAPALLPS